MLFVLFFQMIYLAMGAMSLLIFVKVLKGEERGYEGGGAEWSIPSRCRGELSDPATLRHFPLAGAL